MNDFGLYLVDALGGSGQRDNTVNQANKDELTQTDAVLKAIMDAAVDAVVVSDRVGKILSVNPAAIKMFQHTANEMQGHNVRILMPDALAHLHDGFMSDHMTTGEKRIIGLGREVEGKRKDGTVFPLHLSVGRAGPDGNEIFIGIMHDLTQRKSTEAALSRSQRLDAIGQMTGGIAHDFNNILTIVTGNLELLEMRNKDDRQTALIRDALEAAELGADLTHRLLMFARRTTLHPVKSDLSAICLEALHLLERTLGATYRISTDFAADADPVMIDPTQLQSALMNLALNARDAMPNGGELIVSVANVTIDDDYIAQETDIKSGHYVRLSVIDNGIGMPPEAQSRAFEPFFTTKSDSNGTGLGLAMVYGFVRQSGGHITLYSEPGHGTSFGLYFPSAHAAAAIETAPKPDTPLAPWHGNGERILVVEDNALVRKISVERIRDLGFATEEASSGDEAYQMLKDGVAVDLVFSDLVMPGALNGYDLAARIRTEFPKLKVLLTSGYASDAVTGSMSGATPQEILHKPYRQADLIERLHALLGPSSGA